MREIIRIGVEGKKLFEKLQTFAEGLSAEFVLLGKVEEASKVDLIFATDAFFQKIHTQIPEGGRPSFFVCVENEESEFPSSFIDGIADDMFVLPGRRLEFLSKIRLHHSISALRELEHSTVAVPGLVAKLQEDILLAQKIQRRLIRDKFPPMNGISVKSKYWCGMKSGGDYFDVFEFPDKNHVGVLLTDSSSYSLSTSFFGSMMQLSLQFSEEEIQNPGTIVAKLFGGIRDSMKPKDEFSIFYGILDRKTYQFRYVNCGSASAYLYGGLGRKSNWLGQGGAPLSLHSPEVPRAEEVQLEPSDRLVILSDGWAATWGGKAETFMEKNADLDAQALVNEMSFLMRRAVDASAERASDDEDGEGENDTGLAMPPEDCSVLILDVAKNVLRLAR